MKQATSAEIVTRNTCRICEDSRLAEVMDLGVPEISDFPKRVEARFPKVPLVLVRCEGCGLVQLGHTASRDWLYREYFYKSGVNETMVRALSDVVEKAMGIVELCPGDTVIDIGANDGTLLNNYPVGVQRVGIDPAVNLHRELRQCCEMIIPDYFPPATKYSGPPAKIVTSIAMFYDLEDPKSFVAEVTRILHPEGVWVVQLTDLWETISLNAFDNIVAEHLEYYSFSVLNSLFSLYGLVILDIERNNVNGGSVRYYVVKQGSNILAPVGSFNRMLEEVQRDRLVGLEALKLFVQKVESIRIRVNSYIEAAVYGGKIVDVLGASTKGNTLLQYFGLNSTCIRRAVDRNREKAGRYCAGSWIPIVDEVEGHKNPADIFCCLPWGFKDQLIEREKRYLAAGGKLLFPLPIPEVVSKSGSIFL